MKIIDNFLPEAEMEYVEKTILSPTFPWYVSTGVTIPEDNDVMLYNIMIFILFLGLTWVFGN